MLHGNKKPFSNQHHYTRMSFGKGGRKQIKTSSDSVEVTYFSLLVGCADVASPFEGLIPSQS